MTGKERVSVVDGVHTDYMFDSGFHANGEQDRHI